MLKHATHQYQANGAMLPQLYDSLWSVVLAVAEYSATSIICVVDALDECEESSRALLLKSLAEYYSRTGNRSKLRMVITSRPNTLIGDYT